MDKKELKKTLEELMSIEPTDQDTLLSTLITDSLDMLETQMLIEDRFDVNIPVTFDLVTFNDFINLVYACISDNSNSLTMENNNG